ncbi:unnamed protein product [Mytilus edulis]|uniref:Uncharacterized protein n=1 Tax=Mytilus edulis TaxID=6550 RepID=A0A8S3UD09_MYTED|nr:unnamed protein product [Mytilus edulis]
MPLRKLNRSIDYLVSDIKSHNSELEKIQTQFTSFKVEWLEQSKLYVNIPESVIVSSIEAPQIASELASLREYIEDALDKFRIAMESNRSSLDTAKSAVEQLLISEGLCLREEVRWRGESDTYNREKESDGGGKVIRIIERRSQMEGESDTYNREKESDGGGKVIRIIERSSQMGGGK